MRLRLLTAAAAVTLLAAGCTSDGDGGTSDPAERLENAATAIREARALDVAIAAEQLPGGVTGLLSLEGHGDASPSFEGEARVVAAGATLPVEAIAVDGQLWVKPAFSPRFSTVDPAEFSIPDPARLVGTDEDSALTLLTSADDLEAGEDVRDGREVLTTITGTLAGTDVAALLPAADEAGTFDVEYRVTDDDVLHDAVITGPFYAGEDDVTYTLTLAVLDEPVEISAPQ